MAHKNIFYAPMNDCTVPISNFAPAIRSPQWGPYAINVGEMPPTLSISTPAQTAYDKIMDAWKSYGTKKPAPDYAALEKEVLAKAETQVRKIAADEVARTGAYHIAQLQSWAEATGCAYIPLTFTDDKLFEAQIILGKHVIYLDFKRGAWYIVLPDGEHVHTPRGFISPIISLCAALQDEYRKIDKRFHVVEGYDGQLMLSLFDRCIH